MDATVSDEMCKPDLVCTFFLLYRKDRLRRSLELKIARTKAGMTKQTVASLEDIEPFFAEIVIKIVII